MAGIALAIASRHEEVMRARSGLVRPFRRAAGLVAPQE